MNEINKQIILGSKSIIGVCPENFAQFIIKYKPILFEGQRKKFIDDSGNILTSQIFSQLRSRTKLIFSTNISILGIFGELTSKYNPIAVDGELKYGLYLDSSLDFDYTIFDILAQDALGNIHLLAPTGFIDQEIMKFVPSVPLTEVYSNLGEHPTEEGIVIKGWNNQYYKMKHKEVIEWARMVGTLNTVIDYSISHLFSQGLGFSEHEIFDQHILLQKETIDNLITQIWEEINQNGVTFDNLAEFYKTKKRDKSEINSDINNALSINLMLLIAPALKSNGIPKEKLYLEIPKYIYFNQPTTALFYDTKRKKDIASAWYGRMIGRTIGKIYLDRK